MGRAATAPYGDDPQIARQPQRRTISQTRRAAFTTTPATASSLPMPSGRFGASSLLRRSPIWLTSLLGTPWSTAACGRAPLGGRCCDGRNTHRQRRVIASPPSGRHTAHLWNRMRADRPCSVSRWVPQCPAVGRRTSAHVPAGTLHVADDFVVPGVNPKGLPRGPDTTGSGLAVFHPDVGLGIDREVLRLRPQNGVQRTLDAHWSVGVERQPGPRPPLGRRARCSNSYLACAAYQTCARTPGSSG